VSRKKGRILVIDDNDAILTSIQTALAAAGYDVVATSQTVGTARHLKECDLVIIDYHMPGLDGREVLQSLKAAAASAGVKPAFYLYTSDAEMEQDPKRLGFDGVFTKKGHREKLVQQVDAALRLIRLRAMQKG
jgi:CheY-like chemotaxis protein